MIEYLRLVNSSKMREAKRKELLGVNDLWEANRKRRQGRSIFGW